MKRSSVVKHTLKYNWQIVPQRRNLFFRAFLSDWEFVVCKLDFLRKNICLWEKPPLLSARALPLVVSMLMYSLR